MGKKTTTKKKHQHTRSQSGCIKVLLPDMLNEVMEREIRLTNHFNYML